MNFKRIFLCLTIAGILIFRPVAVMAEDTQEKTEEKTEEQEKAESYAREIDTNQLKD